MEEKDPSKNPGMIDHYVRSALFKASGGIEDGDLEYVESTKKTC